MATRVPSPFFFALSRRLLALLGLGGAALFAQQTLELPKVTVYSEQVANQAPVAAFAMPVSGLQFEPRVDVQARNLAEGQADVAIRGGIFENTGFKLGALALYDPQTGHYFAELPVAPAMLTSPKVLTGADNALVGMNAGVGTVAYGWRPITTRGELSVAAGNFASNRQHFYQGFVQPAQRGGHTVAADVDLARSESDGSVPYGDHDFRRLAARLQLRAAGEQTDFFAGVQKKFFGWPNLYTPFGVNETETLKTELYGFNHRAWTTPDNYWQFGGYYRRNYDDYEYNRFIPGIFNPYQHTGRVRALSVEGRQAAGVWTVAFNGQYLSDRLGSTALTFGRFHTRDYLKLALVPEYATPTSAGKITARTGLTYDDTNRDRSAVSPLFELSLRRSAGLRVYTQYAESSQVPTYTALNSNPAAGLFRGNPNLGRETSRNLEAGADFSAGDWIVQAAFFHRRDDDLVDWTFQKGVTARSANPVDSVTDGFELVARLSRPRFDVILGYTCLSKDADYGLANVEASFYALNFPRHRLTAAVVARLVAGLELRLDNEYRVQQANPLRVIGGNHGFLSSVGLYWLPAPLRGLELSVQVDNLWDSVFQEVPAVPASRRQWAVGAAWHW